MRHCSMHDMMVIQPSSVGLAIRFLVPDNAYDGDINQVYETW